MKTYEWVLIGLLVVDVISNWWVHIRYDAQQRRDTRRAKIHDERSDIIFSLQLENFQLANAREKADAEYREHLASYNKNITEVKE